MEILYFLIPVSLVIVGLALGVFFWAVKSGQYDDLEGPAWRILFDDEPTPPADEPGRRPDASSDRSQTGDNRRGA